MNRVSDYFDLTKMRLSSLVVVTTAFGMALAPGWTQFSLLQILGIIIGTAFIVASANVFNCVLEKDTDALMERTKNRPLPQKRLHWTEATVFGVFLFVCSIILLKISANQLAITLSLIAFFSYVFLYTPLKRISSTAVFIGAVPGAIPPMIGYAAIAGDLSLAAWILFWILFFWQLPHFIAISLFRFEDYNNAGLKTLPGTLGKASAQNQMILYTAGLVAVSFTPYFAGLAGAIYLATAILAGILFATLCVAGLFETHKIDWSRVVFFGSLAYLPIVLGIWAVDRWIATL